MGKRPETHWPTPLEEVADLQAKLDSIKEIISHAAIPAEDIITIHSLTAGERFPAAVCFYNVKTAFAVMGREGWKIDGQNLAKKHTNGALVTLYNVAELARSFGYED